VIGAISQMIRAINPSTESPASTAARRVIDRAVESAQRPTDESTSTRAAGSVRPAATERMKARSGRRA
jgi:hypothetical protein